MTRVRFTFCIAILGLCMLGSCADSDRNDQAEVAPADGGTPPETSASATAATSTPQADPWAEADSLANSPAPQMEAHYATSEEAGFEAKWPSGCAGLGNRRLESIRRPGETSVHEVYCERFSDTDRGCKVTIYNELIDNSLPTPGDVTRTISDIVGKLGLEIWKQQAIGRGDREGVVAYCRELEGPRQVWIEGFIVDSRVLLVMAWDHDNGLYYDPEIAEFFHSIRMLPRPE